MVFGIPFVLPAHRFLAVILVGTLFVGCGDGGGGNGKPLLESVNVKKISGKKAGQPKPYSGDLPSLASVNIRDAVLEELVRGLKYPWAFEFISDRDLLVTEFAGAMKIFDIATGSLVEVEGLPKIPSGVGQVGLMDVALHPDFHDNGIIYFSHAVDDEEHSGKRATAVSRAVLGNGRLEEVEQLFVATPFGKSPSNFGGALAFDDEGYLYIGTGDRSSRDHAQDRVFLTGKIIRLTDDGEAPPDNPFVGDESTDDRIYALGVRNPQGLFFDEISGMLFETEHGPMGGDEVNVIEAGRNYGWPVITYGSNYTTQRIGVGTTLAGMEQPLFYYLPSIATSPIAIYRGAMFPEWEGDILVGPLKGSHINKLDLVDKAVRSEHRILDEVSGRIRDIKISTDGSVYILAQSGGRIYRLYRDTANEDLEHPIGRAGAVVYRVVCASCHSAGTELFPQLSDPKAWRERLIQGREILEKHAIEGVGDMPPKGFCETCSDKEIKAAVDYMIEKLQ
jgi:glucose/arabinose dehydrogenase/cytochrome c5